jgi:hypothetical protein
MAITNWYDVQNDMVHQKMMEEMRWQAIRERELAYNALAKQSQALLGPNKALKDEANEVLLLLEE